MQKGFKCFCCTCPPVIGVTVNAGIGRNISVKQNLCGILWKHIARHIPDVDIVLFVTADTLN